MSRPLTGIEQEVMTSARARGGTTARAVARWLLGGGDDARPDNGDMCSAATIIKQLERLGHLARVEAPGERPKWAPVAEP